MNPFEYVGFWQKILHFKGQAILKANYFLNSSKEWTKLNVLSTKDAVSFEMMQSVYISISSVMEFLRWWVLKSKMFLKNVIKSFYFWKTVIHCILRIVQWFPLSMLSFGKKILHFKGQTLLKAMNETHCTVLSRKDAQESEFCSFFGRIEDVNNWFWDLLTISTQIYFLYWADFL